MKRLIVLAFGFWALNSLAQPTSIAGIVPGVTTFDELRMLATNRLDLRRGETNYVQLKELDNKRAWVRIKDDVVYEVEINLMFEPEIVAALISKYGKPTRKVGEIKKVTCQNKLGAKFERVEGTRTEYWKAKDGIQAALVHKAYDCAEQSYVSYLIYHQKIRNEIELDEQKNKIKQFGDKVEKINKGI